MMEESKGDSIHEDLFEHIREEIQAHKKVNFAPPEDGGTKSIHSESLKQQESNNNVPKQSRTQGAIYNSMKRKTYSKYDLVKLKV